MIEKLLELYLPAEEILKTRENAQQIVSMIVCPITPQSLLIETRKVALLYPLIMLGVEYEQMKSLISIENYAAIAKRRVDPDGWANYCVHCAPPAAYFVHIGIIALEIEESMSWRNQLKNLWKTIKTKVWRFIYG